MSHGESHSTPTPGAPTHDLAENGAALAALLSAAIGTFALGLLVILGEAKLFTAPSLYPPSGGLSGRATFATLAWLIAWGITHRMWSGRKLDAARMLTVSLVLIALGLLFVFPPVWGLL